MILQWTDLRRRPVKPLIWVEAAIESHNGSRVEYVVKCKAQFKRRSTANNVEIYVGVPDDADSPRFRVSVSVEAFLCRVPTEYPSMDAPPSLRCASSLCIRVSSL